MAKREDRARVQAIFGPGWVTTPENKPQRQVEDEILGLIEAARDEVREGLCLCGSSAPDEFGNRDQLVHSGCPLHGEGAPYG